MDGNVLSLAASRVSASVTSMYTALASLTGHRSTAAAPLNNNVDYHAFTLAHDVSGVECHNSDAGSGHASGCVGGTSLLLASAGASCVDSGTCAQSQTCEPSELQPMAISAANVLHRSGFVEALATELLLDAQFPRVLKIVDDGIEVHRDTRVVDWCILWGYTHGHVPVLYKLARNKLKFQCGSVPSFRDMSFGLSCALVLLLRVAQDVRACKVDLAKADRDFVYFAFRDKLWSWLEGRPLVSLPTVQEVLPEFSAWVQSDAPTRLPLPTWATAFSITHMTTFSFGVPTDTDTAAFRRSQTVEETRDDVLRSFCAFIQTQPSWQAIFKASLHTLTTHGSSHLFTPARGSYQQRAQALQGQGQSQSQGQLQPQAQHMAQEYVPVSVGHQVSAVPHDHAYAYEYGHYPSAPQMHVSSEAVPVAEAGVEREAAVVAGEAAHAAVVGAMPTAPPLPIPLPPLPPLPSMPYEAASRVDGLCEYAASQQWLASHARATPTTSSTTPAGTISDVLALVPRQEAMENTGHESAPVPNQPSQTSQPHQHRGRNSERSHRSVPRPPVLGPSDVGDTALGLDGPGVFYGAPETIQTFTLPPAAIPPSGRR
jgi:hypothetical protein